MPIKVIATDIDGTLLNSHHQLSERNENALKAAMAKGVQVILATGRPRATTAIEIIERLGLQTPGIFLQGLAVYDATGALHRQETFDPDLGRLIIEHAEQSGYSLMAYAGARIIAGVKNQHTDRIISYGEPEPEIIGTLHNLTEPFNKLVFFDEPGRIAPLRASVMALLGGRARIVQTLPESIEVLPNGISKGAALAHLLDEMQVDPADVIAFGDAENDLEMITLAGLGVAMGNAMPLLKEAADYITGTNDEDGVAQGIEKFVL